MLIAHVRLQGVMPDPSMVLEVTIPLSKQTFEDDLQQKEFDK